MRALSEFRAIVAVFAAVVPTLALLIWAPAGVSFGLALLTAVYWCIWLEQNPAA